MRCFKVVFKTIFLIGFFLKASLGYGQTLINFEDFELNNFNLTIWNDGGNECDIVGSSPLNNTYSVQLKDKKGADSSTTSDNIDLTPYGSIDFIFDYRTVGMHVNDGFLVEFSNNGGTTWFTLKTFVFGTDFNNNTNYLSQKVTVNSNTYPFTSNSQFRIRCDAKKDDNVYLDNILIKGNKYCASNGDTLFKTGITLVSFNSINNATGPSKTRGYEDFTGISTDVQIGSSHNLTVNVNTDGNYTNYTYAWIDWNQDGDFSDAGESYNLGTATNVSDGATANSPLTITIPATANVGPTRMRVSTKYFSDPIPCGAGFDGEVEDYTINITNGCSTNIWTGAIDSNWNNALNWSCGIVPTNSTNVLIPTGLINYPEIYNGDPTGYANNIEFEPGTTLIIYNNSIEIEGDLLLNGNIDLNGESQLIQIAGSDLDTASTGTIQIDQQGVASTYAYNYWGSPVGTTLIPSTNSYSYKLEDILYDGASPVKFISGYNGALGTPISIANRWIYKYADKTGAYSEWQQIGSAGTINAGEGFTMKGPNPTSAIIDTQNYTFKGKPNNGVISLDVSANNEYLVANPYPSAIDANQFIWDNSPTGTGSLFDGTLYFWEQFAVTNHNLADYQGGYASYSLGGGVPAAAYPGLGGGTAAKTPQQYIPVAQGFFTESDADGGNIEFNNGQRIFITEASGNSIFMKPSNTKNKTANVKNKDIRPKFRLGFEAPQIKHRQLLLTIDENTTNGVDWGYDGEMNGAVADDMYWDLNNKKYVIQALPNANIDREVPLGIVMNKTGLARIKIDALENVDESAELYIKDALTGKTHQINTQPFEIALDAGTYVNRFSFTFSPQNVLGVEEEILKQGIHVFMNNATSEIQIRNTVQAELFSVKLYNSLGQILNSWNKKLEDQNISLAINNIATGVYLVQINTTTGTISKKVVIE